MTTITDEAPIMNWVYVDKDTYEVKYGVRLDAQPNLTGPFDCTRQDRRLTFDGWEGWCAVEEFPTLWALYFDVDDDGLRSKIAPGTRVLEVELTRKEKRWKKEADDRQSDQTTKREVDTKEDAPTDKPVIAQPQLDLPGVADIPPEPLKIPTSIFVDNSEPLEPEPQAPLPPPKTPPPAYTTTMQPQNTTPPGQVRLPYSSESLKATSPNPGQLSSSPPLGTYRSTTTPEKRTTPKLNRQSGSRALAQAQMFEAMALGQKSNESPFKSAKPASRPPSNADSASDYSGERISTMSNDILTMYDPPESAIMPPNSSTPAPLAPTAAAIAAALNRRPRTPPELQQPIAVSDPAVWGGVGRNTSETTSRNRLGSDSEGRDAPNAPNASSQSMASSSTSINRQPESLDRRPDRSQPKVLSDKQMTSADRTRTASPQQRGPNALKDPVSSRNPPRRPLRPTPKRPSPPPPRQKNGSASSLSQNEETSRSSPRPLTRTNTAPTPRKSMASTMTTGARNRGMANRLGSNESIPEMPRERNRSNSSLYREIDEMVGTGRDRSGSGSSTRATSGNEARRNDAREGNRPPPLRRAATSRLDLRGPGGRNSNERAKPGGFLRRGERDFEENRF